MSIEMAFEMMEDYPPSLAAKKKMKEIPESFAFYAFSWLGDSLDDVNPVMKVVGAQWRKAKTGKNKGKYTIKIKGTERTVFVTSEDILKEN